MGAKLSSGGGGKRGSHDVNADPNVIPFIDVMLVLLIIFMVAAPIATVDIQVPMPAAQDIIPSKRPPKPTWISLKQEAGVQRVYVMNDESTWDNLGEDLYEDVLFNTPDAQELTGEDQQFMVLSQRVYLRAQGDMEYRHVVRVMNQLQRRGFIKVALVAEDRRQIN